MASLLTLLYCGCQGDIAGYFGEATVALDIKFQDYTCKSHQQILNPLLLTGSYMQALCMEPSCMNKVAIQ